MAYTSSADRAAFDRARYQRRRTQVIEFLGSKCARCGSVEDLQFDHVDASTKTYDVSSIITHGWQKLESELAKCQLLCEPCHAEKTRENQENPGGASRADLKHGTVHAYGAYKCRCGECRKAKSEDGRRWRLAKKMSFAE